MQEFQQLILAANVRLMTEKNKNTQSLEVLTIIKTQSLKCLANKRYLRISEIANL